MNMNNFNRNYWQGQLDQMNGSTYELFDDGNVREVVIDKNGEPEYHYLGMLVMVTKIIINLQTDERRYVLSMVTSDMKIVEHEFSGSIFNKSKTIEQVSRFGGLIRASEVDRVINLMQTSLTIASVEYVTSNYGWLDVKGLDHYGFIGDKSYLVPPEMVIRSDQRLNLNSKGSIVEVNSLLKTLQANIPIMTVVAASISSLVFPLLVREGLISIEGLLLSIQGSSSTGKSTAAKLATSLIGNANGTMGSLKSSWGSTEQAQIMKLSGLSGIPLLFDELGTRNNSSSLGNFAFTLADGHDRARGDANGHLRPSSSWSGVMVISTSEDSILSMLPSKDGTLVRVLELSGSFARSGSEAEHIGQVISKNYGHAIPALMKVIEEHGYDTFLAGISDTFLKFKKSVINELSASPLNERLAANLALILVGAELTGNIFDVEVDVSSISNYLITQVQEQLLGHQDDKVAQDKITQFVLRNHANIGVIKYKPIVPAQPIGYILSDKKLLNDANSFEIAILSDVLKSELKRNGINNLSTVLNKWEAIGFLVRNEDDRKQVRKTIDGHRNNFYILKFDRELLAYMPTIASFLGSPKASDSELGSILTLQGSKHSGLFSELKEAANE